MSEPTAVSLFSGLGGIDIGLHRAGVETLVTVDLDEHAADTLRANSSRYDTGLAESKAPYNWEVLEGDIKEDISAKDITEAAGTEDIDFIVGGPPCQTFSRSNEGNREGTGVERGMLFKQFSLLLQEIEPRAFLFENVRGLSSANDGEDFEIIKREFKQAGYTLNDTVLNAANFGVPQTRKRLFVVGLKKDSKPYFPDPSHVEAENALTSKPSWVTAKEALHDFDIDAELTADSGYENAVGGQYGYLLKDIPPGGNYQHFSERKYNPDTGEYVDRSEEELEKKVFDWRSRHYNYLLKQDPNRPTWTIQASPGTYVGPFHWRSRRYSFLEQMRLMDIPVDYEICGPPREVQRQIGNAVPPGLVEAIVRNLLGQLNIDRSNRDSVDHSAVARTDGGTSTTNFDDTVTMDSEYSPWQRLNAILQGLSQEGSVIITGEGSHVAQVIDVVELLRRQLESKPEIELQERVKEDPDGKSNSISVLTAHISI